MAKKQKEKTEMEEKKAVGTAGKNKDLLCDDKDCFVHGKLKARGRTFEGKIIRKMPRRLTIEFERMIYIRKYERYKKSRTKIHARIPKCMENSVKIGDLIKIQECRPLSKIIHFVVVQKIKDADESGVKVK